jgi:DNA modification methylase
MKGDQKQNEYSQYIWRRYASSVWMDIRIDRVLPHREAKDDEDEKHVHPLQLDVIERSVTMWSNPEETVLTPFMGVGSEVYGAVSLGRRAIGCELKPAYFNQAVSNLKTLEADKPKKKAAAMLPGMD